ncbi:MAG TPA: tetratricopeptide repeat protein [Candidatus Sulfopaludibacter sp.]|nr:tetratricopeptide repeat protein [Candidatus Sulfopaludibacter sp.]
MDAQTDPRRNFVPRLLPWLLAGVALGVYLLTLNYWVSLFNLTAVARTSGWMWQPEVYNPVSYAVTQPFHWLPAAQIPLALNVFSAVCAALTLGLLARSVALLPHDRTDAQRRREQSPFSLLTIRNAWLPPLFAVAMCGLQLTFWEYATNYTGEMVGLLLFAFVIWSLLEYRLDEREERLFLAAFVHGAAMANDWAMVCYFPAFLTALIWIRGLGFFNSRFLGRMFLCGLAGTMFYLLLPLAVVISGKVPITFWQMLHLNLSSQFSVFTAFFENGDVRKTLALMSLSSLVPVLILSIRWHPSFGDTSQMGRALATLMFHFVHAVFLIMCVWVAFDPPFSPRENHFGLTLYYLSALGVGYYSGYFLLVFRKEPGTRFLPRETSQFNFGNFLAVTMMWLLFFIALAGLVYKNAPQIYATNNGTFQRYTSLTVENLPRTGGILLSDDWRYLYLTEAKLTRDGRAKDFIFLDTPSLVLPAYHQYLHEKYPKRWPNTFNARDTNTVNPLQLVMLLTKLARTNELYYLHPSFGYYFEQFYLEPHGLVYRLKTLPGDTLVPPLPDSDEIDANEAFWARAEMQAFEPIERALATPRPEETPSWGATLLGWLHARHEQNVNAVAAGGFYSRSLNYWGVELQRAGNLAIASEHFEMAQKLNPENAVARINLQFNHSLQAGEKVPVDLAKTTLDQFGRYNSWSAVLDVDGPFDEPSFCFANGLVWVRNGFFRQALTLFARVCQIEPDNLPAHFWLAQLYGFNRLPDRALKVIQEMRSQPETFPLDETNQMQLTLIEAAAYYQKNDLARGTRLLDREISQNPTNNALLVTATQFFVAKGLYTNALEVINARLRDLPDDPNWLFSKSYVYLQLRDYDKAIPVLNQVLAQQADNHTALFNRAVAYLSAGKLDDALADYEKLNQAFTDSFQIEYGLGEIAWRKHETNNAIKYYKLYLASANTNSAEATNIMQRLRQLEGAAH